MDITLLGVTFLGDGFNNTDLSTNSIDDSYSFAEKLITVPSSQTHCSKDESMKLRFASIASLFLFSTLGYWGYRLLTLDASAEAISALNAAESSTLRVNSSNNVIEVATSLANRSRYVDAMTLLQTIPAEDKNFARASRLQNLWGEAILMLGEAKLKQGKTSEGKAILKTMPQTARAYAEAKRLLQK